MYEIRDPVHRTIEFSEREKALVDHPYVQRLRHIRQLGLSFLVYPGANHDRFSHAVGAMHIAGRVFARITETSGDVLRKQFKESDLAYFREVLRCAALLHDIGHAPFSHVSEKFMPPLGDMDLPRAWFSRFDPKRKASHEDYSILLIAALSRGRRAPIREHEAQDIASLIHHDVIPSGKWQKKYGSRAGIHDFLHALISGEIDCDRMDYLLRDAHHTGVAYGLHDMEHLIANLGAVFRRGRLVLTIDLTAVRAFEDFLLARYHMYLQVYLHKTTTGFDYFLDRAFSARELSCPIPGDAAGFARLRDGTFWEGLFAAAENPRNTWSRRLVGRHPAKLLLSASGDRPDDQRLLREFSAALRKGRIFFFVITSRQYLSRLNPSHKNESPLLVRRKILGRVKFEAVEHYSSLLQKYNEVINIQNLYVLPEDFIRARKAIRDRG